MYTAFYVHDNSIKSVEVWIHHFIFSVEPILPLLSLYFPFVEQQIILERYRFCSVKGLVVSDHPHEQYFEVRFGFPPTYSVTILSTHSGR